MAGKVKATRTVAPAHLQHRSFIPGLGALNKVPAYRNPRSFMPGFGADPMGPPAPPATTDWSGAASAALNAGAAAAQQAFAAKTAQANARAAEANAQAMKLQSDRALMLAAVTPSGANMAAHGGISGTMMAVAAVAVVGAIVLFARRGAKK